MTVQSFNGFLLQYSQQLLDLKTVSLKKMFAEMSENCPCAEEVLFVHALAEGRGEELVRLAGGTEYEQRYFAILSSFNNSGSTLIDFLQSSATPVRYRKVYNSYMAKTERLDHDREVLADMAVRMNQLLDDLDISRYALVKEMGCNKGNLYAFLKGDVTKMSRKTAERGWMHLERLALSRSL